jgi:hypothetical protein
MKRPIQGISSAEAAVIHGIRRSSVDRLVMRGILHRPAKRPRRSLDRDEVEWLALERYKTGPPGGYRDENPRWGDSCRSRRNGESQRSSQIGSR